MGYEPSRETPAPPLPVLLPLDAAAAEGATPAALHAVATWARQYLCCPHADLGRNGPVCPFVPGALQKQLLFAAIYEDDGIDAAAAEAILLREMERFIALPPVSGNEAQFKSLLVLFPALPAERVATIIETAQARLQPRFVPNGLMVGEFHAGPPDKRGLWNTEFRPLHCPVPMLAIRHMVPTDLLFLKDDASLFGEYLKIYGNAVPERFRAAFDEAVQRFGLSAGGNGATLQAAPRITQALDAAGVGYRVHCHDDFPTPIRAPQDFADALGYAVARISKTLFVKCRETQRFFLLVCGMDKRANLRGIAQRLGTRRLEMASLAELQQHVGYPPTSVTPIAVDGIPVFIDETLLPLATVLAGAGVPRVEIEIAPADLAALCAAQPLVMT